MSNYHRALVTGGAGFIGSHIVERLIERGLEVVVVDNFSTGRRENLPASGVEVLEGDVRDKSLIERALRGVDIVFHEAARVAIRSSGANLVQDAETNVMGLLTLLSVLPDSTVRKLVFASSMAVYGDAVEIPIREDHPLEPRSAYGLSKLAGEKYCLMVGAMQNIDVVVLRYFNTFGPRQTLTPYVGVITIFSNRLLAGESPIIFGDGLQLRDFIYVGDVAEANMAAMTADVRAGIFNVGTGRATSVNEIAHLLGEHLHSAIPPVHAPPQLEEPRNSVADVTRTRAVLGFESKWTLAEKLPEVIAWNSSRLESAAVNRKWNGGAAAR
ncbi:MAG: NAD-dependent epimerase/dehydratase family protein [Chloroflexota bacterium]|nr:MAG: NAD-dependent epimerase/dehydratase family protein [Chloroflexota bacterium]